MERGTGFASRLSIGLILPMAELRMGGDTPRWSDVAAMARLGEAIGVDSLWVPDHLLFQAEHTITGQWESLSILAGLAAVTDRVALGTLVASTTFRSPALLAKMIDTIDEISDGRVVIGLGAGWNEYEHRAFGMPFDYRASRFEEAVTIVYGLLRHGQIDFAGSFYSARDCELRPRGRRAGGPPIMVGTRGERMLRLTARFADSWNVWLAFGNNQASEIPELRTAVDAACRDVGREPATLRRSVAVMVNPVNGGLVPQILVRNGITPEPIEGQPDEIVARLLAFEAEGIDELQVHLAPSTAASIEAFAPILAKLRLATSSRRNHR